MYSPTNELNTSNVRECVRRVHVRRGWTLGIVCEIQVCIKVIEIGIGWPGKVSSAVNENGLESSQLNQEHNTKFPIYVETGRDYHSSQYPNLLSRNH